MRCDSHVHIVGPADRYPQVPDRTYLAGVAPIERLQALAAPHGIARFVVVQPSFYGTDNSATLRALDALGEDGRGVAVIDPRARTPDMLSDFQRRGVCGLRINLYSPIRAPGGDRLEDMFAATAAVAQRMAWHVQVIAPLAILLRATGILARAPVPVVIDHYGLFGDIRPDSPDGRALLALAVLPHVWIKLSAPYRMAAGPLATRPDRDWLAALLAAAPDRCVWGSDWPHPPPHDSHKGAEFEAPYRALSYARLVEDFLAALPDARLADAVMRDNPVRLYGF